MLTTTGRRNREKRVTLVDVASDAGVSRATASLVVRDSPLVTDGTRDKVLASMQKLCYVYNRSAATLRTQRSHTVGLVVPDITNPFFAEMTVGCETELEKERYTFFLANSSENLQRQSELLDAMTEHSVDGLLLCPATGTTLHTVENLRQRRLPFVMTVRYLFDIDADYVGADNIRGAEIAVERLIAMGHRRIAFIGGSATSSARRDRAHGYERAHERHGLAIDHDLSVTSAVTREGGKVAVLGLLDCSDPPTAALCYNDIVAFGVMLGLQSAGRVPGRDVSVMGFDDIEEAAQWRPALTTVAISPHEIGASAARLLLERIKDPTGVPRQVILEPRLVIRDSCGDRRPTENDPPLELAPRT